MSEYVIMPKEDYQSACDTIREASGKTDLIKSCDLYNEISELSHKIGKAVFKKSTMPFIDYSGYYYRSVTYGNG